jgi:hypothetical protein
VPGIPLQETAPNPAAVSPSSLQVAWKKALSRWWPRVRRTVVQRERWERLERLFSHGLALAKPERTAWLERACADDAELRCEVEELLLADAVHGVLDTSPFATDDAEATAIAPSPGEGHTRRRRSRNARDEIERSGLVEDRELHSSSADLIEGEFD